MKKISILTATRAEYSLLKPVIKKLKKTEGLIVEVIVTGAHLSPEFGFTYKEIEDDSIEISEKIEILLSSDTPASISKSMGLAMIGFSDYFSKSNTDLLIVLGDRYEALAVVMTAMNFRIPVVHLHGGEATEGLIDEAVRHSITKMSYVHFTSTEAYRKRVIQLGESPDRVFNVGSLGVENIKNEKLMSENEIRKNLGVPSSKKYALVTFHPVTLDNECSQIQIEGLLKAIENNDDLFYIFTKANADADGRIVNRIIEDYVKDRSNCVLFESLGMLRYLSAVKYSSMVIGNSSSGIIEVPSFGVPTINIGDRQKGRIQAKSVINCATDNESINKAILKALNCMDNGYFQNIINPYEGLNTSDVIVSKVVDFLKSDIDIKKKFYDL